MPKNSILSQMPIDLGNNLKLRFATPGDTDALAEFNSSLSRRSERGPKCPRSDVWGSSYL